MTYSTGSPILDFLYILLNGISEVPLISSPLTGLLILIGVLIASRKAGFMMAISGLIGAGVAIILGAPYDVVTFGLFGYNSVLTGMALWSGPFVKSNRMTFIMSCIGAGVTSVTFMVFDNIFSNMINFGGNGYAIPGFTSSFIFTTWFILFASKRYGWDVWPHPTSENRSPHTISQQLIWSITSGVYSEDDLISDSENPKQVKIPDHVWTFSEVAKAILNGVSQVTFVESWIDGVLWVIGLTLSFQLMPESMYTNSYTSQWSATSNLYLGGVMALIGSAIGFGCAVWLKLPEQEIKAGIHGFNQVLVMIALTSFLPLNLATFLYAVLATIVCSIWTMPAMQNFLGRWGIPTLTGPFVFTAWGFILAAPYAMNIPFGLGWGRP